MLNRYPMWKYLMVIFIIAIGCLYALPNIYGKDPALQISADRGASVTLETLDKVQAALKDANVNVTSSTLNGEQVLVRFKSDTAQNTGREVLQKALGDKYIVAMNLVSAAPEWLSAVGGSPMNLGLDLRGGVHFLIEVDMNTALETHIIQLRDSVKQALREKKAYYRSVRENVAGQNVKLVFRDQEAYDKGFAIVKRSFGDYQLVEQDNFTVLLKLNEQKLFDVKEKALLQNITIIRNRVNALGVAEPLVQRQGLEHIVIELPGIQDTAMAKQILEATATLEFHMLDETNDVQDALRRTIPGSKLVRHRETDQPYLVKNKIILKGSSIVDASAGNDEYQRPQVSIVIDSKATAQFSAATKKNVGKPMVTVFIEYKPTEEKDKNGKTIYIKDEKVINVANIQTQLGSSFRITGIDSPQEAQNLALLLRAGALVAPIQIVEERTVGPSLGKENIEKGFNSVLLGFALVLAFMFIYYKKFGLVANLALAANLVMIVAVMSMIPGATLTLPGIAGIVLTVGMAVDANVLIFERIREEIREGRSPQQAIHHGYESAFSTIADANITTLIAAIILFFQGTGPIKGFAVTLAIGIVTSMFTAIVGTRAVVNATWGGKRLDKLSI